MSYNATAKPILWLKLGPFRRLHDYIKARYDLPLLVVTPVPTHLANPFGIEIQTTLIDYVQSTKIVTVPNPYKISKIDLFQLSH